MFVCICNSVTDREIREAAKNGANTLEALSQKLKVATCCGRCADCARRILQQAVTDRCLQVPAAGMTGT